MTDTPTIDTSPAGLRVLATRIDEYIYAKYLTSRSDMSGPIALKAIATLRAVADEKERAAPAGSVAVARRAVVRMGRELAEARYADDPRNAGRRYEVVAEAAQCADALIAAVRAECGALADDAPTAEVELLRRELEEALADARFHRDANAVVAASRDSAEQRVTGAERERDERSAVIIEGLTVQLAAVRAESRDDDDDIVAVVAMRSLQAVTAERDALAAQLATAQRRLAMARSFVIITNGKPAIKIIKQHATDAWVIDVVRPISRGIVIDFHHPTLDAAFTAAEAYLAAQV